MKVFIYLIIFIVSLNASFAEGAVKAVYRIVVVSSETIVLTRPHFNSLLTSLGPFERNLMEIENANCFKKGLNELCNVRVVSFGSAFPVENDLFITSRHIFDGIEDIEKVLIVDVSSNIIFPIEGRSNSSIRLLSKNVESFSGAKLNIARMLSDLVGLWLPYSVETEPLKIASIDPAKNDIVFHVGYPIHGELTFQSGQVKDLNQCQSEFQYYNLDSIIFCSTSKTLIGQSGGPVLNQNSEVVGLNSFSHDNHSIFIGGEWFRKLIFQLKRTRNTLQ